MPQPTLHHIPVCPFSQRLDILLALKERPDAVRHAVVDITRPRDPELLRKTRGTTALPVLELPDGRVLKESLVLMQYLEDSVPGRPVAQHDPWRRAVEGMLTRLEGPFVAAGYGYVMNQDPGRREALREALLAQYRLLDDFLQEHAPAGTWLFEDFGWAEAVFTPMFMRFWFVEYYEGFELPDEPRYARVRRWRDACIAHPAAQQVTREEIVKLYHDYARGAGNGALLPGRTRSSFVFEPHWRSRPWPPRDKWGPAPSDAELGLV
ncbi:MAG: glutathione S-transferase family protein [Rubrivivax sp.]|nr:glutathione S-transferase family protein [Rubrivivax sp.]